RQPLSSPAPPPTSPCYSLSLHDALPILLNPKTSGPFGFRARQYCQLELAALWCERTSVPATLDAKLLRKLVVLCVALRASGLIGLDLRLSDIGQMKSRRRWYLLLRVGGSEQSVVPGLQ